MKNVGSTVVSHFVPSTLVLRRGICYSALQYSQCVIRAVRCGRRSSSREENWCGLGGLGWPQLALGGPLAGLGGLLPLAWGRGSHLTNQWLHTAAADTASSPVQCCK